MTSSVKKVFTGIAGLPVCTEPQRELSRLYGKILRGLEVLPKDYKYRTATEKLINERKAIVESTKDGEEIEKKIGAGQCEELIEAAKHELKLIDTLKTYKPWEPIEEKPNSDQWKWPL